MAIINSGSFAKALWPGVNAWYGKAYSEYPVEYTKLFETFKSSRAFEEDVGVENGSFNVAKPGWYWLELCLQHLRAGPWHQ